MILCQNYYVLFDYNEVIGCFKKKKLQNVSNSGDTILSQIYFALFSSNEIL